MKLFFLALLPLLFFNAFAIAQTNTNQTIVLWPEGAPGALGKADKDIPTLTVYLPESGKASGAAMIVCPGGGYAALATHEGRDYALWLCDNGITAFVLKYRLGTSGYRNPIMLQDVTRAVRLVRSRAAEWKVDSKRVGIMGSSAGGHLASTLLTHFVPGKLNDSDPIERESSRPDLGVLCYPVITMGEKTHKASRENLLGKKPSEDLIEWLSNEKHVKKDTPPCFLFHTMEDKAVPVENSIDFALALRHAGVPFELHVFQTGKHGMGLGRIPYSSGDDPAKLHPWTHDCIHWLKEQGFIK